MITSKVTHMIDCDVLTATKHIYSWD